jgi:ATP-dependent helicase/nuclease subunit B
VQVTFLLGPAGSGKTHRCLAEIRAALRESPDGPPLVLLAPKQATFQLERQLLADGGIAGCTRLRILSFERLAGFVFDLLGRPAPPLLDEEGRVMVLRALLGERHRDLRVFHATARLPGFASHLSELLRELQRHHLSADRLSALAGKPDLPPPLRDKLHDVALLLRAYLDWLTEHKLEDADRLLDLAAGELRSPLAARHSPLAVAGLWLDGFAEMTPQELELLAALAPCCERATLAFCLEREPEADPSWLSIWSVVAQTFRRCHARLASLDGCEVEVEVLQRDAARSRFNGNPALARLEQCWAMPTPSAAPSAIRHPPSAIRLLICAHPEAEAVLAAREILRHVRAGGRFREAAVLVRSLDGYHDALRRVFTRYDIPFFLDRREPVAHHPLAELTRFALRTVAFGWKQDDWFGALKTSLAPADDDAIDVLENAALAHGWSGKAWHEPLTIEGDDSLAARCEQLRQRLIPPFAQLADALAGESTPRQFTPAGAQLAAALREFWVGLHVEKRLADWSAGESANRQSPIANPLHATVLGQMLAWLDNLELAFPTEALPLREWLPILEAGLSGLTVGAIPPALDQVLVGAIDRSRNPDLRLALVLGLNETVFPAAPAPATVLTDADRAALKRLDVFLGPGARQRLGHERYFGYIACTRARQRLVLTCAARNAQGQPLNPSPFFDHVKQLFPDLPVENFAGAADWRESEHRVELAAPVLTALTEPAANPALARLAELPALAPLVEKWRACEAAGRARQRPPAALELLYGRELAGSVSGLEEFAACPFKFFLARGLRLEERKEFQFDARDVGSFQHEVLREFHQRVRNSGRNWRDLGVAEACVTVANLAHDLLPYFGGGRFLADGAARFTGAVLRERLERLMAVLIEWMAQYEFDPAVAELNFGLEADGLPAWWLDLGDGRALALRGRIDRVDLFRPDDDTALAVVVDYKSRARSLDRTKLHHGLELQLLSYLGVLGQLENPAAFFGAKKLIPAGVFYVPLAGGGGGGGSRADVLAGRDDARRRAYQHSGRLLADALQHFDNRGASKGDQFKYAINKDGGLKKTGNEALPAAEFTALQEKITAHLGEFGRRIFAGEVAVEPFRIGKETACDRCDFRAVCRFDPWTQPYRQLKPPPKPAKEDAAAKPKAKRKKPA